MIETAVRLAIRPAVASEIPALEALIEASARALSRGYYSDVEIEAAIDYVFGVDSELVSDGSYLVAERDGIAVGCGGWSRRRTLFGGDRATTRDTGFVDPSIEPARIRAFFVTPGAARSGVGAALLAACETAARDHGFGGRRPDGDLAGRTLLCAPRLCRRPGDGARPRRRPCSLRPDGEEFVARAQHHFGCVASRLKRRL